MKQICKKASPCFLFEDITGKVFKKTFFSAFAFLFVYFTTLGDIIQSKALNPSLQASYQVTWGWPNSWLGFRESTP